MIPVRLLSSPDSPYSEFASSAAAGAGWVNACVGLEQCLCSERSERAERSERSEHVWPQIVRNIDQNLTKIRQNHQSQHVEIWGCQF